ncbi:hypothetical protein [Streptomyces sp. NBC_01353]|uniref:hypothetical protein n=1 Tax=Streptomyces sp. NBC_01353 TaxID=2903835 RepID=UPI003DA692FD
MGGHVDGAPRRAVAAAPLPGHARDTRLLPVRLTEGTAVPLAFDGPAMLRGLALADGLAVVPPGGLAETSATEVLGVLADERLPLREDESHGAKTRGRSTEVTTAPVGTIRYWAGAKAAAVTPEEPYRATTLAEAMDGSGPCAPTGRSSPGSSGTEEWVGAC